MKKLLIVIDMQNDFIDGALGTEAAAAILPKAVQKIAQYRRAGGEIVFTRDTHHDNYLHTQEGRHLPVIHCVENTAGWEISDRLTVGSAKIINKNSFGSIALADYAADVVKPDEIELIGLCTDICVISNAMILKAKMPEVPIVVDAACCAGATLEGHQNALYAMKACQIEVIGGKDDDSV